MKFGSLASQVGLVETFMEIVFIPSHFSTVTGYSMFSSLVKG